MAVHGVMSSSWMVMVALFVPLKIVINRATTGAINVQGQNPFVISTSIFMGVYAFGPYGVLIGPVFSGLTLLLFQIYKQERKRDQMLGLATEVQVAQKEGPVEPQTPPILPVSPNRRCVQLRRSGADLKLREVSVWSSPAFGWPYPGPTLRAPARRDLPGRHPNHHHPNDHPICISSPVVTPRSE